MAKEELARLSLIEPETQNPQESIKTSSRLQNKRKMEKKDNTSEGNLEE